jgi:hypothetical protein
MLKKAWKNYYSEDDAKVCMSEIDIQYTKMIKMNKLIESEK